MKPGGYYESPKPSMANVTGFMAGCYAIESLLQSTLECFFNQTCLNTLLTFFPLNNITDIDILLAHQTQFLPTTLIETIVDELFIDQWSTVSSFAAYYKQCAPISYLHDHSTQQCPTDSDYFVRSLRRTHCYASSLRATYYWLVAQTSQSFNRDQST